MYNRICNFAKQNGLVMAENRKMSKIAAYIVLDWNGEYHGIELVPKEKQKEKQIPDFGPFSRVELQPNPICEKANYLFAKDSKKYPYWVSTMQTGKGWCESLDVLWKFIERYDTDDEFEAQVLEDVKASKLKDKDVVSFRIDDVLVEDLNDWNEWLLSKMEEFHNRKKKSDTEDMIISSISGELQASVPADSCPEIKNIPNDAKAAFGVGSGIYTVSMKESSFQSYGFDGSKGSQIGLDDAKYLAAGLEELLSNPNHRNKDFGIIYMYDESDLENLISETFDLDEVDDDELEAYVESHQSLLTDILRAVYDGVVPNIVQNDSKYHMATFNSPARSRFYLSDECSGTYKELQEALYQWYDDTHIVTYGNGKRDYVVRKLYAVLLSCISNLRSRHMSDDVNNELGKIKPALLQAVYQKGQIPEILYVRSVDHIVKTLSTGSSIRRVWIQLIKCYLIRKGLNVMPELNAQGSAAYTCGRLFATYEAMQKDYNRGKKQLNKVLSQNYFTAVLKQPSIFFPKLADLGVVYLGGIKWSERYKLLLGELSEQIGTAFPQSFTNEEKGEFILGYYQQQSAFVKAAIEAREAKLSAGESVDNIEAVEINEED